jgi:GT2 family glycosyltransferase
MPSYSIPPGATAEVVRGRPVLVTPQGGKVAVDAMLQELWQFAHSRDLATVVRDLPGNHGEPVVRAALACLAEAGLLERTVENLAPDFQEASSPSDELPEAPPVSVVIVGYNSRRWLAECLPSLQNQTHRALEILVVDNGSQDSTRTWLAEAFPQVRCSGWETPHSLAEALNHGVAQTAGEYLLLLNPDVKLAPDAIQHLVNKARQNPEAGAVAAKLKFWWLPAFINGLGNYVGRLSWGTDLGLGHLDLGQFDSWEKLPSGCFAALLIPRAAWEAVGTVDTGYPMYYEDTDWSYRARLANRPILAAPEAVVYHAFGGEANAYAEQGRSAQKTTHIVYGRLRFVRKIVASQRGKFLLPYLLEDSANLLRYTLRGEFEQARALVEGWRKYRRERQSIQTAAEAIQETRQISDRDLFGLQRDIPQALIWQGYPELTWDLVQNHYLALINSGKTRNLPEMEKQTTRKRLLIISNDIVDFKLAGPGVRYLELGKALAREFEVTLAVPNQTSLQIAGVSLASYNPAEAQSLENLVQAQDAILYSPPVLQKLPFLAVFAGLSVVDLYDPIILENVHYYLDESRQAQLSLNQQVVDLTNRILRSGDFFLAGNERQRDFWLGMLAANGRVNPLNYQQDDQLRGLIDVVGLGVPDQPPAATGSLRRHLPQIPENAPVVLWGGGLWDWLDPLTLLYAWPVIQEQAPQARLVFLGTRHPNPDVPQHAAAIQAIELAARQGSLDKTVFFLDWLPYEDFESVLAEAAVGVSLHPVHLETHFSIRKRVIDYLWARLPVVTTEGDIASEWVRQFGFGLNVPPHDPEAVAAAVVQALSQPRGTGIKNMKLLPSSTGGNRSLNRCGVSCGRAAKPPTRVCNRKVRIRHPRQPAYITGHDLSCAARDFQPSCTADGATCSGAWHSSADPISPWSFLDD